MVWSVRGSWRDWKGDTIWYKNRSEVDLEEAKVERYRTRN